MRFSRRRSAALVFTLGALAGAGAVSPAEAAAGGTFNVLTYNIAGLPEIISSAPTPRKSGTTAIGERLGPYSIVNVQEDFNYHAYLYAADGHPYRTPTSGPAVIGSGLNTLSDLPFDGLERVRWNWCWIGSADCLTPKGFTFARVRLAEGAHVDLYNLHADAGNGKGDLAARATNYTQLTKFLRVRSAGNAVIVMGDTNTRYTRTADTIAEFVADNGLTDVWVQRVRGGSAPAKGDPSPSCDRNADPESCESIDKILYRSGGGVTLTATSYGNEHAAFREDSSGLPLSDHDPITAGFTWTGTPAS